MQQPKTQILSGSEGIKTAYTQALGEPQLNIVCLSTNYQQIIGDFFDQEFSPKIYGQKLTREILPDSPTNRAFAKTKDAKINQVRFVELAGQSESDLIIGENLAVLISFSTSQPHAIVINDKNLINNLQLQFDMAWQKAKR